MIIDFNKIIDFFININLKLSKPKLIRHKWFAWYPVKVNYYRWVWFVNVYRVYEPNNKYPISILTERYKNPKYYEIIP